MRDSRRDRRAAEAKFKRAYGPNIYQPQYLAGGPLPGRLMVNAETTSPAEPFTLLQQARQEKTIICDQGEFWTADLLGRSMFLVNEGHRDIPVSP